MRDRTTRQPLRVLHIGDLHVTEAGLQNHRDLARIVDDLNTHTAGRLDFVVLPGDIADDGTPEQFRFVRDEMSRLKLPWRAIPGDHDFKPGQLDDFFGTLGRGPLPRADDVKGCLCLFLDVVSAGTGGPDFRLGRAQIDWLRKQLADARRGEKPVAIFMHTYPADLGAEAAEVAALIDDSPVVLVDMGHTHYNEISNDGRTIYAATRSTGQIEEGDVGFSFMAIDEGVVSWRFKPLEAPWPLVMITSPSDRRLAIVDSPDRSKADCRIRACVWGATSIATAEMRIDDGDWQPMTIDADGLLHATSAVPGEAFRLSVRVIDRDGAEDSDTIEVDPSGTRDPVRSSGSDAGSIGAWPERHLLGTQLGPNRNGKKW